MIQHARDCNIRTYIKAMFENKLQTLADGEHCSDAELQVALQNIHEEFLDASNGAKSESDNMIRKIEALQLRLKLVATYVSVHRKCMEAVGEPFHPAMDKMIEFGYRLKWDKEKRKEFLKSLDHIEKKEKRYELELSILVKNYNNLSEKQTLKKDSGKNARVKFLSNINSLNRFGFSIDKEKTDMEEYGLMLREYSEYVTAQTLKNKRR